MNGSDVPRIPLQLSQGCIVASIQIEITAEVLQQFRQDILERLHTNRARGIILDLSGVEIMDLQDFETLRRTLSMAAMMGVETILTGFQPGVASALVDLNADIDSIYAALDIDDAWQLMNSLRPVNQDTELLSENSHQEDLKEN
ncbi:anti-anti-sigma regulatory factor (antagonist of anti-sigma factor) [Cylindrospermum stagnale PCC 7417]|uniref:Anti-anti-sigma regulatory factor (Antagonist of anti-sigma factor) n=1 Tax=Cylindrospermum stagnale PCC 7417 TaxID=56107 RepID=K9X293_9NOST|nr:STAS domain-containing protein [Cylindrospermum stagnale]AFZ26166.1 anti-anti-sigma regulatory factor (antagonist of anti-sigma factor) [Cylindrospermum stagnale PCC 7417]